MAEDLMLMAKNLLFIYLVISLTNQKILSSGGGHFNPPNLRFVTGYTKLCAIASFAQFRLFVRKESLRIIF